MSKKIHSLCKICNKDIYAYKNKKIKQFCSMECRNKGLSLIPHKWNINKKGTFLKGHKISELIKDKISKTRLNKYSKEQRLNWSINANKNKSIFCHENNLELLRLKEYDIHNNSYYCINRIMRFIKR